MIYWVSVRGFQNESKVINLCNTEEEFNRLTVKHLKEKVKEAFPYYSENLQLVFRSKHLREDSSLLCSYGVQHMCSIHLVLTVCGGGDVKLTSEDDDGMGDKTGKNRSMEKLSGF